MRYKPSYYCSKQEVLYFFFLSHLPSFFYCTLFLSPSPFNYLQILLYSGEKVCGHNSLRRQDRQQRLATFLGKRDYINHHVIAERSGCQAPKSSCAEFGLGAEASHLTWHMQDTEWQSHLPRLTDFHSCTVFPVPCLAHGKFGQAVASPNLSST